MLNLRKLAGQFHEHLQVRGADVVAVSYPKSGRTWLRLLVGRALAAHYGLLDAVEKDPDLLLRPEQLARLRPGAPSVVFSHDDRPHTRRTPDIERDKRAFYGRRVVFLHRDPRDVAVSQFFSLTKRTEGGGFSGALADFVRDEDFGPANHVAYLNVWAAEGPKVEGYHALSYEALSADPARELGRVLAFAGVEDVSAEVLADAVAFGAFDNMREMEAAGTFKSGMLRPADPGDPSTFKTREGRVGGFVDHLAPEDVAHLDRLVAGRLDARYGY